MCIQQNRTQRECPSRGAIWLPNRVRPATTMCAASSPTARSCGHRRFGSPTWGGEFSNLPPYVYRELSSGRWKSFLPLPILGHTSVTTTENYQQSLGVEDLQAVHDRLSLLN